MVQESREGWHIILQLADWRAKEIFYKLDGQGEFKSTGFLDNKNPQTGVPMINSTIVLPKLAAGAHAIEVKYLDRTDKTNGPYAWKFSTVEARVTVAKNALHSGKPPWVIFGAPGPKPWLAFTILLLYRPVIKEIRYSLNSENLDRTFPFKPSDKMMDVQDIPTLETLVYVPAETRFACVQVTYVDGTKSPMQKYEPKAGE
jgi:hypothetical protein